MTKDEILKISRKENSVSDERTEYIGLKGANFSVSIMILLWIILSRFTPMDQAAKYAMGLLVTATCCYNWLYQLIRVKNQNINLFLGIIFNCDDSVFDFIFESKRISAFTLTEKRLRVKWTIN